MTKKTKKTKTKKRSKRIRNKKNISKKYFGGVGGKKRKRDNANPDPNNNNKLNPLVEGANNHLINATKSVSDLSQSTQDNINKIPDVYNNASSVLHGKIGDYLKDNNLDPKNLTDDHVNNLRNILKGDQHIANLNTHIQENIRNPYYKLQNTHNVFKTKIHDLTNELKTKHNLETDDHIKQHIDKLKETHGITPENLSSKLQEMREKYETSGTDVDLKNALELENALKLHEEIEELLKNPLIAQLLDESNESVNELLISGMKLFGNAVSGAAESIPVVGEIAVLENTFRRLLYNISDASSSMDAMTNKVANVGQLASNVENALNGPDQQGGAMQHRINTSIHDFLQSSKLNTWWSSLG